jgi:hypothetical protein
VLAVLVCPRICGAQSATTPSEASAPRSEPRSAAGPPTIDTSHCQAIAAGDPHLSPLSAACEFALTFRRQLPDFICEETITNTRTGVVKQEVTFGKGGEQYSNITINGVPAVAAAGMRITSWGELGTDLVNLFRPPIVAEFRFRKEAALHKIPSSVYEFHIAAEKNRSWVLKDDWAATLHPEYGGELWLERQNGHVLRLALRSMHLPKSFEFDEVDVTIDYSEIPIEGLGRFLLPSTSLTRVCFRAGRQPNCTDNITVFHDCRKFATRSRIITGDPTP